MKTQMQTLKSLKPVADVVDSTIARSEKIDISSRSSVNNRRNDAIATYGVEPMLGLVTCT